MSSASIWDGQVERMEEIGNTYNSGTTTQGFFYVCEYLLLKENADNWTLLK